LFDGFIQAATADTPGRRRPDLALPQHRQAAAGLINDMQLVVIEGGPHALVWTHADQVNRALLGVLD
jgi:pimeloyl-ACP methyl ester carboxylesterase